MNAPGDIDSTSVIRTRTAGGLSGVTFHTSPRARLSLPYHSLQMAELSESGEVVLTFKDYEVTLHGAALQQLPEDFILHRILRVLPTERGEFVERNDGEVIERIATRRTADGDDVAKPKRGR